MLKIQQKTNGKWEIWCPKYQEAAWGPDGQPLEFDTEKAAKLFDDENPDTELELEEENELYDDEEKWQ